MSSYNQGSTYKQDYTDYSSYINNMTHFIKSNDTTKLHNMIVYLKKEELYQAFMCKLVMKVLIAINLYELLQKVKNGNGNEIYEIYDMLTQEIIYHTMCSRYCPENYKNFIKLNSVIEFELFCVYVLKNDLLDNFTVDQNMFKQHIDTLKIYLEKCSKVVTLNAITNELFSEENLKKYADDIRWNKSISNLSFNKSYMRITQITETLKLFGITIKV